MNRIEEIFTLFKETPWWVYLILVYLLFMGFKASKPRSATIARLSIFPGVLIIWSLTELFSHWSASFFAAWTLCLFPGYALGWLSVRHWKMHYDPETKMISLPGSWSTLLLALPVFVAKYFFGYYAATHSNIPSTLMIFHLAVSGIISGMFLGRLFCIWQQRKSSRK